MQHDYTTKNDYEKLHKQAFAIQIRTYELRCKGFPFSDLVRLYYSDFRGILFSIT